MADPQGTWLELDDLRVSASASALLRGRLDIEQLSGRRLAVHRLPQGEAAGGDPLPEYAVIGETGPDHHKLFQVQVRVAGKPVAEAMGRSKKEAEQEAAKLALKVLDSSS